MTALFVTGTDTGVGKTTVSVALLRAARARGLRCAAMKPVESGCEGGVPADATALRDAAGSGELEDVCPYQLRRPVSPSVAAVEDGVTIEPGHIHAAYTRLLAGEPDVMLVEGAGGLLVPVMSGWLMADLAARLELPLLVVARDALGTINHTLMTVEVALARGLEVRGVVLSAVETGADAVFQQNRAELARELGDRAPIFGRLPHFDGDRSAAELAAVAEQHLDLDRLFGA